MKKILLFLLILVVIYFLGPTPSQPEYEATLPEVPGIEKISNYIDSAESLKNVKPGNEAKVVWFDPLEKAKTDVVLLYIHGFTASHQEGFPLHVDFAKRYGCNLYLARLADHGIQSTEPLLEYTAEAVWESTKRAFAVAKQLGNKVVIMSTSTGGTLALRLAATYPEVLGIINYSPNIKINDPAAFLLNDPWGLQIAGLFFGGKYRTVEADDEYRKYWYDRYRLEAIVELQELVETTCSEELFEKVTCPAFNGVYYRDEEHQDDVVRVDAVEWMHESLATPEDKKVLEKFPNAETHVIANQKRSKAFEEVKASTFRFAEDILLLKPLHP